MKLSDLPYTGESMLDVTLRVALQDAAEHIHGKKYKTANLHPYATRGVFNRTSTLSNRELLLILHPNEVAQHGAIDKRLAKHLRSVGKERSQKLQALRTYSIDLLRSREITNADVVCGWVFALVHAAALDVVHATAPAALQALQTQQGSSPATGAVVEEAHKRLLALVESLWQQAHARLLEGSKQAQLDVFLHTSAYGVLAVQARPQHPLATFETLVKEIYPVLDQFGDPLK